MQLPERLMRRLRLNEQEADVGVPRGRSWSSSSTSRQGKQAMSSCGRLGRRTSRSRSGNSGNGSNDSGSSRRLNVGMQEQQLLAARKNEVQLGEQRGHR